MRHFGKSLGNARHGQPVRSRYSTAHHTSYISTVTGLVRLRACSRIGRISRSQSIVQHRRRVEGMRSEPPPANAPKPRVTAQRASGSVRSWCCNDALLVKHAPMPDFVGANTLSYAICKSKRRSGKGFQRLQQQAECSGHTGRHYRAARHARRRYIPRARRKPIRALVVSESCDCRQAARVCCGELAQLPPRIMRCRQPGCTRQRHRLAHDGSWRASSRPPIRSGCRPCRADPRR